MGVDARLEMAAGFATALGPRADNQDFGAVHLGSPTEQALHGVVAVIADGVSGSKAGRMASELATRSFIDGYLSKSPLGGIAAAGVSSLMGFNRWLHAKGRTDETMKGAATTFTALVLRGREAVALHVGDSRAWHWRDGVLTRLTEDHVLSQPGLSHVLYRAVGIEQDVRLDVRTMPLKPYDRLLLTTDGVHGAVDDELLASLLGRRRSPDADAQGIVEAATAAGTKDNATAIVIDVIRLGAPDAAAIGAEAEGLPLGPLPEVGDNIDGFTLERLMSDGRYTRVFLARDPITDASGEAAPIVLKFPKPALLSEKGARSAFLRESFIGRRIDSPYVGKTISLEPGRQSRLYIAQPFYDGRTLHARLAQGEPFGIQPGVDIAIRLSRAVAALHRRGIAHRDIKPDNVVLETDGGLKLIDLGVARLPRIEEFTQSEAPGTPGYMAPEMFDGNPGDALTDQYALGVTLYRLFTGGYPRGQPEAGERARFDKGVPPTSLRPDMPAWLEAALLRTLALDPDDRFADVEELVHVLESGNAQAITPFEPRSLFERDPVRFWQGLCIFLVVCILISLATR